MVGSDGYVYRANSKEITHPRSYGAFSKVLHDYVTGKSLFSLEEFIRRVTYLPTETFRIKGRGLIRKGFFADLVVFKPGEVQDRADYECPFIASTGMRHVMVNGSFVLKDGIPTNKFPGRVIT